jgi:hypothetical protein
VSQHDVLNSRLVCRHLPSRPSLPPFTIAHAVPASQPSVTMPTSFESLPAELRNRIYELSHEVGVHACGNRTKEVRDGVVARKARRRAPGCMPEIFRAHEDGKYSCCLYVNEMTGVQMSLWVNRCSDVAKEGSLKPHPVKKVKARRVAVRVVLTIPIYEWTYVLTSSRRSSTAKLPTALRLASHGPSASICRQSLPR